MASETVAPNEVQLSEIVVFRGQVPLSEPRFNETFGENVSLGGSIILTAHGIDSSGERVSISPVWTADPKVFEITPPQGAIVTVRSVANKPVYNTEITVEFGGIAKKLKMSTYLLSEIVVVRGQVPLSEPRLNETLGENVSLGGSITLTAHGIDSFGERVRISPVWIADPEVFEVIPSKGATVTVRSVARKPVYVATITVESAEGVRKELKMSSY